MNKTISKIFSLILVVILTVGMVSLGYFKIEAVALTSGDFEYKIYYNEWASITGYNGSEAAIEIPSYIGNRPVREIAPKAFYGSSVTEVTIPGSVKSIYEDAFSNCTSLETVNFGEGLESVYAAFKNTAIKNIVFPSTVNLLYASAFEGNQVLRSITFADEYYCDITFKEIENTLFNKNFRIIFNAMPSAECDSQLTEALYELTTEDNKYIYNRPTGSSVQSTYTSGYLQYVVENGEATVVGWLGDRSNTPTAEIPEALGGYPVTSIADFAFCPYYDGVEYNPSSTRQFTIKTVILPTSVTKIGKYSFAGNKALTQLQIHDGIESIGYGAFQDCGKLKELSLPTALETIPDYAFSGCGFSELTIPENITKIYASAFNSKTKVTLHDNIEYLGKNAFSNYKFEEFVMPSNLKVLDGTFEGITTLKKVTFNPGLVKIGNNTFMGCSELAEAEIPDSVTQIGESIFADCTNLKTVYLSENVTTIPHNAFYGCSSIEKFEWKSEKKIVLEDAFKGCSLKNFDFANLNGVGEGAFYESNIESVKIGKGEEGSEVQQYIGTQSFMRCEELQTVALGGNVTEIGPQAFAECSNLETVVIAESVEKIADNAFEGSDNITIYCMENTYAEEYATRQKIRVSTLVIDPIPNQTYTTKEIEPALTVSMSSQKLDKTDYTTDFYNNVNVGTASVVVSGTGHFDMLVSKAEFAIVAKSIAEVQISEIRSQTYEGAVVTPEVTLKYNGTKLVEDKDYSVTYENNNSVGTGTVRIKGLGNYKGTISVSFEITEEEPNLIVQFFTAIADFFISIFDWFVNLFRFA